MNTLDGGQSAMDQIRLRTSVHEILQNLRGNTWAIRHVATVSDILVFEVFCRFAVLPSYYLWILFRGA